jgi:hypothetical protein
MAPLIARAAAVTRVALGNWEDVVAEVRNCLAAACAAAGVASPGRGDPVPEGLVASLLAGGRNRCRAGRLFDVIGNAVIDPGPCSTTAFDGSWAILPHSCRWSACGCPARVVCAGLHTKSGFSS